MTEVREKTRERSKDRKSKSHKSSDETGKRRSKSKSDSKDDRKEDRQKDKKHRTKETKVESSTKHNNEAEDRKEPKERQKHSTDEKKSKSSKHGEKKRSKRSSERAAPEAAETTNTDAEVLDEASMVTAPIQLETATVTAPDDVAGATPRATTDNGADSGFAGEDDYAEDFETYDDDFENFDDDDQATPTLPDDESRDTIGTPRQTTAERQTSQPTPSSNRARRPSAQSRIDFEHATEAQLDGASLSKARRRQRDILKLVEFDVVTFVALELAPVKDYDLYMQNFGKGNRSQVQTQTGEDAVEREIQTEPIDDDEKWSQHPPTEVGSCGGGDASRITFDTMTNNSSAFDSDLFTSRAFAIFIETSGQLICDILEEERQHGSTPMEVKGDGKLSDGFSRFSLGSVSTDSVVTAVEFSNMNAFIVATAFYIRESIVDNFRDKSLISVWNLNDTDTPQYLLSCETSSKALFVDTEHMNVVYAGLEDGSVSAWDLDESNSLHPEKLPWKNTEVAIRSASYDTAFMHGSTPTTTDNSQYFASPVVSLALIGGETRSNVGEKKATYQVASLEQNGSVHIWTVIKAPTAVADASESDLGLRPNSALKLVKSVSITPSSRLLQEIGGGSLSVFTMVRHPKDQSRFYLGTDNGSIITLTRSDGNVPGPKAFYTNFDAPTDALTLDFSPFVPSIILAGFSDGVIRLYRTSAAHPLRSFTVGTTADSNDPTSGRAIRAVRWSTHSPYVFFTLHGNATITVWDLKHSRETPSACVKLDDVDNRPRYVSCIAVAPTADIAVDTTAVQRSYMAIGFNDGTMELHQLPTPVAKYSKEHDGDNLLSVLAKIA